MGQCCVCGKRLAYLAKRHRYNARYCSWRCRQAIPPKLAQAMREWGATDPYTFLLGWLNSGKSLQCVADLCAVQKQAVAGWLRHYGIIRVAGKPHRPGTYAVVRGTRRRQQLAWF